MHVGMGISQLMCRDQRTILGSQFSPSTLWVPGIEFRLLGLVANTFTYWAILPACACFYKDNLTPFAFLVRNSIRAHLTSHIEEPLPDFHVRLQCSARGDFSSRKHLAITWRHSFAASGQRRYSMPYRTALRERLILSHVKRGENDTEPNKKVCLVLVLLQWMKIH